MPEESKARGSTPERFRTMEIDIADMVKGLDTTDLVEVLSGRGPSLLRMDDNQNQNQNQGSAARLQ